MNREWRKRIRALGAVFAASAAIFFPFTSFAADAAGDFGPEHRLLVVAPHPDEEVTALSGILRDAKAAGASVRVVYLTHGEAEGRSILSKKRRPALSRSALIKKGRAAKEAAVKAMLEIGIPESELHFLGYPDGGLISLWLKHWAPAKPYRSLLTRVNRVPFKEERTYGHYFRGDELERDLAQLILESAPTHILVTAPDDPDADHQAAGLFLRTALLDAAQRAPLDPEVRYFRAGKRSEAGDLPPQPLKREIILKDTARIIASFPKDRITYRVIAEELWAGIPLPAAFDEMGVLTAHVFAYDKGTPFVSMPKFTFRLFGKKLFVYERGRSFHDRTVAYSITEGRLVLRLPLALLRQPRYLFISARTAKESSLPDFGSWKLFEVI